MKIEKASKYAKFEIGFLFTITNWYKGQRNIVITLPFIIISWQQIHKDFKIKEGIENLRFIL